MPAPRDEVSVSIGGKRMYLWRAVDDEGEVLDILVQARWDKRSALRLMRKLLKKHGALPLAQSDLRRRRFRCACVGIM